MDRRQIRTRGRLREAILVLAREQSAARLRVSEVAASAGVNRSTFYSHADSPVALLADALRFKYDELCTQHALEDAPSCELLARLVWITVDHISGYDAIYQRGFDCDSVDGSLQWMLNAAFADAATAALISRANRLDDASENVPGGTRDDVRRWATVTAAAHVAAIRGWRTDPRQQTDEALTRVIEQCRPNWWPEDGAASITSSPNHAMTPTATA